jgi:chromosome segregation ATPase
VLRWAQRIGCTARIRTSDIAAGHPRLNLVFVAGLFNSHVGIHLPSEEEIRTLFQEIAGLKTRVAVLDQELEATRPRELELKQLRRSSVDLGQQLEALRHAHRDELLQLEREFEAYKEELAGQYQESLDSALTTERRAHQHELGELRAALKEVRRRAQGQIADLRVAIGPAELDGTKVGEMLRHVQEDDAAPLEQVVALQGHLGHALADVAARQARRIAELEAELAHKERIEGIMAQKVREYSEQLISINEQALTQQQQQQQAAKDRQAREPAISVFRSKTLPALRRAFTCTGR